MIEVRSMQKMAEELKIALAAPGSAQPKLPWYTTAVGGLAGAAGGKALSAKFLPKGLRTVGHVGGLLAGTAAGLEGGEAVGRYLDKRKVAAEKVKGPLRTLGDGLVGITVGAGAGYLVGMGANAALKAITGKSVSPSLAYQALPALGAASGLAMQYFQNKAADKMREANQKKQETRYGRQGT